MTIDRSGEYRGQHYTTYVDTVKALKREGRLDEAITLLKHLVDATESESRSNPGWGVAPWYYEQMAIIFRKRGDAAAEVAILERYARQPHAPGQQPPKMATRLETARSRLT